MSTQLQEVITNSSIRSFNQGYNCGTREEQNRILGILENFYKELEQGGKELRDIILLIENKK